MGVFKGKVKDYLFFYGKEIKDFKNIYFMGGELLFVKVINYIFCVFGDFKEKWRIYVYYFFEGWGWVLFNI